LLPEPCGRNAFEGAGELGELLAHDVLGNDHPKIVSAHDGEVTMAPTGGHNRALADARRARRLTQAQLAERVSARVGMDPPLASGIHVRLLIMDFRGVGTRKGAPDLGECGLL